MSFSISDLTAVLKVASVSTSEAKALIKLLSVDVVKSLQENQYLIQAGSKELIATSDEKLREGAKYWAQLVTKPDSSFSLFKPIPQPTLLQTLHNFPIVFHAQELHHLLSHDKPFENIKMTLLEHLSHASSKEQFTQISNLLFSLMHNTFTIPLQYQQYFGVFQMKKRYNKTIKKSQIDFYAALHELGPISGKITLVHHEVYVDLQVAFKTTKLFLEANLNTIRYKTDIHLQEDIQPLWNLQSDKVLDLSV